MEIVVWTLLVIVAMFVAMVLWLRDLLKEQRLENEKLKKRLDEKDAELDAMEREISFYKELVDDNHATMIEERNRIKCIRVAEVVSNEVMGLAKEDVVECVSDLLCNVMAKKLKQYCTVEIRKYGEGYGVEIMMVLRVRDPKIGENAEEQIRCYMEELGYGSAVEGCHGGPEEGDLLRAIHGDEAQEGTGSAVPEEAVGAEVL